MRVPLLLRTFAAIALLPLTGLLISGCASPGSPKPPSLDLPKLVTDLSAERVGDEVRLRWMTPDETTDGLNVKSVLTAQLCRGVRSSPGQTAPCLPVHRVVVKAGASGIVDVLPPALARGPAELLEYRVELRNRYERASGQSSPVLVVSGAAPPPITGLRVEATEQGALLQWEPREGGDAVELERVISHPFANEKASPLRPVEPAVFHLRVNGGAPSRDLGGTVDATVQWGTSYTYTTQRVRHVELEGHSLELRSAPSAPVTILMRDTFAPKPPAGVEGIAGKLDGVSGVDLSWTPNTEKDLAGYLVFRLEATDRSGPAANQQITPVLVPAPAFRDASVIAGKAYVYTVVAVDTSGNRSLPSSPAREDVPLP